MHIYCSGCAKHPGIYARTRRALPFIAEVLYQHAYVGWFNKTIIKPCKSPINYTERDFAVAIPANNDSQPIRDFGSVKVAPSSSQSTSSSPLLLKIEQSNTILQSGCSSAVSRSCQSDAVLVVMFGVIAKVYGNSLLPPL